MKNEDFIKELNNKFGKEILNILEINDKRLTMRILPESLLPLSGFLFKDLKYRFIIASGFHTREGFEILYHFSFDKTGQIINLHVILPHEDPEIESLTRLFSAADWIEREIYELLGIRFTGHPNLVKLLSKENWPEGIYPFRKDFKA